MLLRLPGTYPAQGDTALLADVLLSGDLARGRRVLDVCTGGGALAVAAARAGAAEVTAVDLSARSAATARANAALHRARVEVLRGDLFAPVAGRRFGLVTANPPYVPARTGALPRHRIARAWDAGLDGRALLDRLCVEGPAVLEPGGTMLLTHSAVADEEHTLRLLTDAGLDAGVTARRSQPFGPVMDRRAALLEERGLIAHGQRHEELVVIAAHRRVAAATGREERCAV